MSKKILIVDDDDMTIMCIKNFCKGKDIIFDVAYNGNDAIDKYISSKYDVSLIDYYLPDIKGDEVLKKMKDSGTSLGRTVFFASSDIIKKFKELGFDDFLHKPPSKIKFEEIFTKI